MMNTTNKTYNPSWVDKVQRLADRLPLSPMSLYFVLGFLLTLILHVFHWISGSTEQFLFTMPLTWTAIWSPLMLAMIHLLDRIASQSLAQFRPAIGIGEEDYERLEYRLITMPSRSVILTQLLATVVFVGTVWLDPSYSGLISGEFVSDSVIYLIGWFNIGMIFVSMYHHSRQLEIVSALHKKAKNIGLWDWIPIFAFSRLSFWTSALTVFMILPSIFIYQTAQENIVGLVLSIAGIALALPVFFLPLQSLNHRLVQEKMAILEQVRRRIHDSIEELNRRVDRSDLSDMKAQHAQLAALMLEQEYLEKLRTWPWPQGTFVRLIGLVALPTLLFIVQLLVQELFFR